MDRPLDPGYRRRKRWKRALLALAGSGLVAWVCLWVPAWVRPAMERDRVRLGRVERGAVEEGILASGMVVPRFEQAISAPFAARVLALVERPGAHLQKGQVLIELDASARRLEAEKARERLALVANRGEQVEKNAAKGLDELDVQRRIKELELESLRERLRQYGKLVDLGAVSRQQVREAELGAARAELELEKILRDADNLRAATRAEVEGLALERRMLEKEWQEALRQVERARVRAEREGVLTWALSEEGVSVGQGEVVARIADLSAFRVEALVAGAHAGRLRQGLPVRVRIDQERQVRGQIARLLPAIEDGTAHFAVELEEPSSPLLRSHLRVDVLVVTACREGVLRLRRGPFLQGGEGEHEVFRVVGARAVRTRVRVGAVGFEYCQIEEGLAEGDEVVLSDTRAHGHRREVAIK